MVISKIKNLDVTLKKTSSTIPRTPNCSAYTSAKIINGLFGFRQYCFQQFQIIIAYETKKAIKPTIPSSAAIVKYELNVPVDIPFNTTFVELEYPPPIIGDFLIPFIRPAGKIYI